VRDAANDEELSVAAAEHLTAFDRAVSDDLNTPKAVAVVATASRDDRLSGADLASLARRFDQVLAIGLADLTPADLDLKRSDAPMSDEEVTALVTRRNDARTARDFAASDRIRDQLADAGVAVEDHPGAESTWRWR
jgi:cysteinyl-tRNA synthetase